MRDRLQKIAMENGAKLFGIADIDFIRNNVGNLEGVPEYFTRAIVCGFLLQRAVLDLLKDKPTPLYFHNYRQVNYQLDTIALLIANAIQSEGYKAIAVPASQIISRDPMRGFISHKLLGWAAGLGYIGRNNLLVHPVHGAQARYVSVLTDMPLPHDSPIDADCGDCQACISVCPAGAIKEKKENFDIDACYKKLCEFVRLSFVGQHICGLCVKVCSGRKDGDGRNKTS